MANHPTTMRLFILIVALLLDPAAVLLLAAAKRPMSDPSKSPFTASRTP